jgi:hypothetical protein
LNLFVLKAHNYFMGKAEDQTCDKATGVQTRSHIPQVLWMTETKLKVDEYIQDLKNDPDIRPPLNIERANPVWSSIDWEVLSQRIQKDRVIQTQFGSRQVHLSYQNHNIPSGVEAEAAMVILYAEPGGPNSPARFVFTQEVKEKLNTLEKIIDHVHNEMYHPRHDPPEIGFPSMYQLRSNLIDFLKIDAVKEDGFSYLALQRLVYQMQPDNSYLGDKPGVLSSGIDPRDDESPPLFPPHQSTKISEVLFLIAWAEETGHHYDPHADYKRLLKKDPQLIVRVEKRIEEDWADFNREAILNLYDLRTTATQDTDAAELKTIEFIAKKITAEALKASRNNPKEHQPDRLEWRSLLHKILPKRKSKWSRKLYREMPRQN